MTPKNLKTFLYNLIYWESCKSLTQRIVAKGLHIKERYRVLNYIHIKNNYSNMTPKLFSSVEKFEIINHRCKKIFSLSNWVHISFVQYIVYKFGYIFINLTNHNQFTLLLYLQSEFLLYDDWINIINLNKAPPAVFLKL